VTVRRPSRGASRRPHRKNLKIRGSGKSRGNSLRRLPDSKLLKRIFMLSLLPRERARIVYCLKSSVKLTDSTVNSMLLVPSVVS
jgi:hypothetical protein